MTSIGWRLFAFLAGLYILTAAGYLVSGDEETMYRVTRNLAWGQGLAVGQEKLVLSAPDGTELMPARPVEIETTSAVPGRAGALYSKYALGQSILALPLFTLGQLLDPLWPGWPQLGPRLAVAMLNPLMLAATGWLLFHFVLRLGYSARLAVVITLAFGLSTMAWPYVNTFYPQPAKGFFVLLAAFSFERWRVERTRRWLGWLGLALAAAVLMRVTALVLLPGLGVMLWLETRSWAERLGLAWPVGAPLGLAVGLSLFYNWLRFGSPFDSGYYEVAWTIPVILGLYGLLFSSGKSIFLYAPLLLLVVGTLPLFFKQHRSLAGLVSLWWVSYLALYAPYNFWTGGFNWGPRFLLPLIPVSLLPCATILHSRRVRGAAPLFIGLFIIGFVIQLPAVVVDHARYLIQQQATGEARFYDRTVYQAGSSPVLWQGRMLSEVFSTFSRPEPRAMIAQTLRQMSLPDAGSAPNRYSAQRALQADFLRLNVPAIWWLYLPLWGGPAWLTPLLALPWLGLFLWGGWGLRPQALNRLPS